MVRLEVITQSNKFDNVIFQFLVVRLEASSALSSSLQNLISIPCGAIRSLRISLRCGSVVRISIPCGAIRSLKQALTTTPPTLISIPCGAIRRE